LLYPVAPSIISEMVDQTQIEGGTVFFACQADGEPSSSISWYFNGVPLDEANTAKYKILNNFSKLIVEGTLTIVNVESSDVGIYTCNATNVVSSDTSSGVLTINGELQICVKANIT